MDKIRNTQEKIMVSKLSLIDLAGSERVFIFLIG